MAKQSKGSSSTKTTKSTSSKLPTVDKSRVEKFSKGGQINKNKK